MLAQYRDAVARARPDDARDLALARQFVLPGRRGVRAWDPSDSIPSCRVFRLSCKAAHWSMHTGRIMSLHTACLARSMQLEQQQEQALLHHRRVAGC